MTKSKCSRCGGTGLTKWLHVDGGECFACRGSGEVITSNSVFHPVTSHFLVDPVKGRKYQFCIQVDNRVIVSLHGGSSDIMSVADARTVYRELLDNDYQVYTPK